jgi:streptomycin 6-kinase
VALPDLEALGAVAREAAAEWGLEVGAPFAMSRWSFVAPAGEDAVVKATAADDEEAEHEADALALWAGAAAVRLLRRDRGRRVLLLERARPGRDLSHEPEEEATATAVAVAQRLWRPAGAPFRPVLEWVERWLDQAERERRAGCELIPRARRVLAELAPREDTLVHGDYHHHNLLRHGDGWAAIDPKPYLAEPEFDVPSFLWNPWDPVAGRGFMPLERTLRRIAAFEAAGLDGGRIRAWTLIRGAYLGAEPDEAETIRELLR